MINGLQSPGTNDLNGMPTGTNKLRYSLMPHQNGPGGDYIGFNPTTNQEEYGCSMVSQYGLQIRATPAYGSYDYFPTFPFRGIRNYVGSQKYGHPISEMLYSRFRGYRGILPINQLPLINKPYPYTIPAYEQFGEA